MNRKKIYGSLFILLLLISIPSSGATQEETIDKTSLNGDHIRNCPKCRENQPSQHADQTSLGVIYRRRFKIFQQYQSNNDRKKNWY